MEGVGADIAGVLEEFQELRGTGVQHAAGLGVKLLPHAAQLYYRKAGVLCEPADVGFQSAGSADAVAENVALSCVPAKEGA